MDMQTKVPQTYLENINMINSATLLMNGRNTNFLLNSNSNILPNNDNRMLNSNFFNSNSFFKTKNDNSTNMQSPTQNELFVNKRNIYNSRQNIPLLNKLNDTQKFAWKEIMNNNILEDENQLENPLTKNILNSKINENEIQNIPENCLVNLINTLQGIATKAIENKNDLEIENKKLYNHLSDMNNNYNNMAKANSKMNQSLTKLKRQNNEQKNLIKNYENSNYLYNNNNYKNIQIDNYLYTKNFGKFHCKYCTNKIFKSKYYLDKHIKRRHPDNYDIKYNKENIESEQNKLIKIFEKKLNEMKKYFDLLINASIKKTQYIRLNEKLNGLQNLVLMSKQQENLINNNNYYYNNTYNKNNNYNNDNNNDINIKEEKYSYGENNINENNIIKLKAKNSNTINNINNENDEEIIRKKIANLNNQIKTLKNEMYHFFNKSKTELLEINREKHFQAIKNYFEKNHNDNISIHQTRRNKKIKTIKASNNIIFNNIKAKDNDEINQSADEIKKDLENKEQNNVDVFQSHKKMGKDLLKGVNTFESNKKNNTNREDKNKNSNKNIIDLNVNNLNANNAYDNNNTFRKQSQNESEEKSEKKDNFFKNGVKISFSGSENHSIQKDSSPLEIFFDKFRDRDGLFSKAQEEDYLKEIINKNDIKLDKKEIEKIVDEKIEKKLININTTNNEDLVSDIIKLNYQILDQNLIYGDVFCFYSRNISILMDTKKLINEANNYYYHYREAKDIKNIQDRKEANQNLFETVNYQVIKDSPSFESEFSLKNN